MKLFCNDKGNKNQIKPSIAMDKNFEIEICKQR